MADTCIALRIKMADVYIALSHHTADEMGIIAVWFNYVCLIKCFQVYASQS
jgi:uridylate kinase